MTARDRYFEESLPKRGWIIIFFEVIFFPFWLLRVLQDEICGQGRWYRRQVERIVNERPPLSDEEFLRDQDAHEDDVPIWLAVRRSLARSCDVPTTAIYPNDQMYDLWRMQFPMADVLEICFRIEKELAIKVPYAALQAELMPRLRDPKPAEVRQFAQMVVRVVRNNAD